MPKYVRLTVDLAEEQSELAQAALHEAGALGLEVRDGQTLLMPGVRAPRPGRALLFGSYADARGARRARRLVQSVSPGARTSLGALPAVDWSTRWKARVRATRAGRLWVGPPWLLPRSPRGSVRVVVEPKMAFGTGDHPTTALCLEAVDAYLSGHPGASVLDVGTGTGVLAIAAKKLGAGRVVALDNDPTSVQLARECARTNGVRVQVSGKTLGAVSGRFDLVVANILANTLIELAPRIAARVGDRLLLAGILGPQAREVERAYVARGLRAAGSARRIRRGNAPAEWVRLDFARAGQ